MQGARHADNEPQKALALCMRLCYTENYKFVTKWHSFLTRPNRAEQIDMTDRELQKLNRRELLELFRAQTQSYEAAKKRLEELEEENRTLKESLTHIGKTMKERRAREDAVEAALAEKTAALAEKDAALQSMERELAEAGAGEKDRERLEEQVELLFERFRQLKPAFQEKDRQLQTAEKRIAEQEKTIRALQERVRGRG